jgi:hypothetical protein
MTTQTNQGHQSFIHTAGGQALLLLVAVVVITAIAWAYVW